MVLAAGSGKRLRPLTVHRAKPALPLLGTPMIEYVMRRLARAGVREAVVNLHHEAKMVEAGRRAESASLITAPTERTVPDAPTA